MTTFHFRSDPVNVAPMVTPALFPLNHRTFRCLGLAGPPVLFSLNPSAGPRVSFTVFLPPRETVALHPAPVRRSAAATPTPPLRCRTRAAPAPLRRRATDHAPAHRLSRAPEPRSRRPVPRLHRLQAADRAPPSSSSSAACITAPPAPLLPIAQAYKTNLKFLPPFARVHAKCSRNCHLGRFRRFRPCFARIWPTHS